MSGSVEPLVQTLDRVHSYEEIGLMSPAEAKRWRDVVALTEGYVDDWPYAEEAVRERAREYLRSLIRNAPTNEHPEPFWQAMEFFGCIRALSRNELSDLEAEFDDARGVHDEDDGYGDEEPFDDSEVLRYELGPSEYVGGVCITSVQVVKCGVVVNWHAVREGESRAWHGGPLDSLTDDLGTEYVFSDSNSQQLAEEASLGSSMYSPAIPDAATELRVLLWGHELTWKLQAR